jgi:hypothetical protein
MSTLSRLLVSWLAISLLALSGCGQILDTLLERDLEEPPVKNEPAVLVIGQQFGDAIQKENYPAAYQLLTSSRRAEQTLEQFAATAKQQRQEYFEQFTPARIKTEAFMLYKDFRSDWPQLPAEIKYDSLLGCCTVMWEAEGPDLQVGDTETYSIEVDIVVVDEAGQARIAYIDWQDDY